MPVFSLIISFELPEIVVIAYKLYEIITALTLLRYEHHHHHGHDKEDHHLTHAWDILSIRTNSFRQQQSYLY